MLNSAVAKSVQQEASHPIFTEFERSVVVNLKDRTLKNDDVDAVLKLLRENKELQRLDLENCGLFPEEVMRIARTAASSQSLEMLNISRNAAVTTRGGMKLSNRDAISIAKIFRHKEIDVVLTDDHIDKNVRLYLVRSKSFRCSFGMRNEYKLSDINMVAFIDTLSEKALANLGNPRDFKLDTSDIQSLNMSTNTSALLHIALSMRQEIPAAKVEQFLGIAKYDIGHITASQYADIAFADSIAVRYVSKNYRYRADPIGLDFQDFLRLSKGADVLVKNALMLKHDFTKEQAEDAMKNLKKECAVLIEKMKEAAKSQQASEEAKAPHSKIRGKHTSMLVGREASDKARFK